jgi:hypothetical protein
VLGVLRDAGVFFVRRQRVENPKACTKPNDAVEKVSEQRAILSGSCLAGLLNLPFGSSRLFPPPFAFQAVLRAAEG